jgi:hypothetical protein
MPININITGVSVMKSTLKFPNVTEGKKQMKTGARKYRENAGPGKKTWRF